MSYGSITFAILINTSNILSTYPLTHSHISLTPSYPLSKYSLMYTHRCGYRAGARSRVSELDWMQQIVPTTKHAAPSKKFNQTSPNLNSPSSLRAPRTLSYPPLGRWWLPHVPMGSSRIQSCPSHGGWEDGQFGG